MNTNTIIVSRYEHAFCSVPILTHKLLNPMDVRAFFMALDCVLCLRFHPGNKFVPAPENGLTQAQCDTLNRRMEESYTICDRYEIDICEVANNIAMQLGIIPGYEGTFQFNTPDKC